MKVIVVYDSVSTSKATKRVAEIIGESLREKGVDASAAHFGSVDRATLVGYDCVIAGAPTMAFRMSRGMGSFLDGLKGADFRGKLGAAFDTQIESRMSGNAAKGINERLEGMGFTTLVPPLVAYVEGGSMKGTWQLKTGEAEKAKGWAYGAATAFTERNKK